MEPGIDPIESASRALEGAGLRPRRDRLFRMERRRGLSLRGAAPSTSWQRFASSSVAVRERRGAPVAPFMDEKLAPDGPFKLLPADVGDGVGTERANGRVRLVADLPLAVMTATTDHQAAALPGDFLARCGGDPRAQFVPHGDNPFTPWAENVRDAMLVLGLGAERSGSSKNGPAKKSAELAAAGATDRERAIEATRKRLELLGWAPSRTDSELRVNFESRHSFSQALLRFTERGLLIEVVLAHTRDWSRESLDAVAEMARRAGELLRLVRVVHRPASEGGVIVAQVALGRLSPDSPWSGVALECLQKAASELAPAVPLLGDSELARWILSSSTRCPVRPAAQPKRR